MTNVSAANFAANFYSGQNIMSWQDLCHKAAIQANVVFNSQYVNWEKQAKGLQFGDAANIKLDQYLIPHLVAEGNVPFKMNKDFLVRMADHFTRLGVTKSHQLVSWGAVVVMAGAEKDNTFASYGREKPRLPMAIRIAYHCGNILAGAESYFHEIHAANKAAKNPNYSLEVKYRWDYTLEEAANNFMEKIEAMKGEALFIPPSDVIFNVIARIFPTLPDTEHVAAKAIISDMINGKNSELNASS